MLSSVSVYSGPPTWWVWACFRSKVDEFVPQAQNVNLRIVPYSLDSGTGRELPGNRTKPLMCSGSEAGSYLRLIDFVYHSALGSKVIKKKKKPLRRRSRDVDIWDLVAT